MGNFIAAAIGLATTTATLVSADATNNNASESMMLARSPIMSRQITHVERLDAEPENEQGFSWAAQIGKEHSRSHINQNQQGFSWAAQVGRTPSRLSQMELDSKGFSWVTALEAQAQRNLQPVENSIRMVLNEKHREMVGAEAPQPSTPKLKPLFSKAPKGKYSSEVAKEKNQPRSFFGALLN